MGDIPMDGLRILQGEELLTVYRFNTRTARALLLFPVRHLRTIAAARSPTSTATILAVLKGSTRTLCRECRVMMGSIIQRTVCCLADWRAMRSRVLTSQLAAAELCRCAALPHRACGRDAVAVPAFHSGRPIG